MLKEIEIKSLLTKEKYEELKRILPEKFKQVNKDSITTVRFKPKDIRVRYSDKIKELIFKDGDATTISRKEMSINLGSLEDCQNMILMLKELGFSDDPSWIKHKEEFVLEFKGYEYTLSLQHIENFAYILEAEIITSEENPEHIPNLKEILTSLGCSPINAEEFKEKIEEYIRNNR